MFRSGFFFRLKHKEPKYSFRLFKSSLPRLCSVFTFSSLRYEWVKWSGWFDHRVLFDVSSFWLLFHRSITCVHSALGGLVFVVILNKVIYLLRWVCAQIVFINRCKVFQWNKMWLLYLFSFVLLSSDSEMEHWAMFRFSFPLCILYRESECNGCNEIVSNCLECIHLYKWKWICNKITIAHTQAHAGKHWIILVERTIHC